MHEYDAAFKETLQHVDITLRELLGASVVCWHNVEFPEVRSTRADLLGETEAGDLVHIELQSSNDAKMPIRMLEYCLDVMKVFNRYPTQVLLYVGDAPAKMETALHGPKLEYSYRLVDVRDLDGEQLLHSSQVDDNIVALLTRLSEKRRAAQLVLQRIAELAPGEREKAFNRLLLLAGLRRTLGKVVEEEARKMAILNDILDHEVIGPEIKKGFQQGMQQGVQQGVQQGELKLLRRLIEKRFGQVPAWADERLSKLSEKDIEALGLRLFDVKTIEELLP